MESIKELINAYPNDYDLGRELVSLYKNEGTEELKQLVNDYPNFMILGEKARKLF